MINRKEIRHRFFIRANEPLTYNFLYEHPMYYETIVGVIFPKIYFRKLNDRVLVRNCAYAAYYSNIEKAKDAGVI